MTIWHKLRFSAAGICVALFAGQPAMADDTEIFVGRSLDRGQANVLFLIDTSGSMGSQVDWDAPYDPNTVYSGSCATDRIYFGQGTKAPDCGTSYYVYADNFVCQQGLNALATDGKFLWSGALAPIS